jgi:rubrerythrin
MQFENLDAILEFAIEKEIEAAQFYDDCSEMESLSGSRDMLKEFAVEERKHQAMLEDFKDGVIKEEISDYKLKWITDIKRSDFAVNMEYSPGMAYHELLMLAMKREEKALKLYNDMLDKAESDQEQKVFKILCQEEAKHKLALEKMYDDYMAEMGD